MATRDGSTVDATLQQQPQPGSGTPQPPHDGREYWRRRALRAEAAILELTERIARVSKSTPPPALGST